MASLETRDDAELVRLVLEGETAGGALELHAALDAGGLGPEATLAGLELLGRAALAEGDFQTALESFRQLLPDSASQGLPVPGALRPQLPVSMGHRLGIEDWLRRTRWAAGAGGDGLKEAGGAPKAP